MRDNKLNFRRNSGLDKNNWGALTTTAKDGRGNLLKKGIIGGVRWKQKGEGKIGEINKTRMTGGEGVQACRGMAMFVPCNFGRRKTVSRTKGGGYAGFGSRLCSEGF